MSASQTDRISPIAEILIVDDEDDYRAMLNDQLVEEGYAITEARNGIEALGFLSTKTFDLIITDHAMPEMNGLQLCAYIKTNVYNRRTPIMFISGNIDQRLATILQKMNILQVIEKPVSFSLLSTRIKQTLKSGAKPLAYNPKMVECVQQAFQGVFGYYYPDHVNRLGSAIMHDSNKLSEVNASIVLFGQTVYGSVSLSYSRDFFRTMHEVLFGKFAPSLEDTLMLDMAGELCNQVAEGLKHTMLTHGLQVNVGLPLVQTEEYVIPQHVANPKFSTEYDIKGHLVYLEFSLGTPRPASEPEAEFEVFSYPQS